MAGLPVLVEHGWLVSKLLCAACGALGATAVWIVGRASDLRRVRRRIREQLRTAGAPTIGATLVRGVMREANGERWIVSGDDRIALRGNVRVVRGTRARWSLAAMSVAHRVDDGDEVIARGQLARVADPAPDPAASYRSAAARWVLTQFSLRAPIEVTALDPAASPSSIAGPSLVAFFVFALLGSLALGAIGRSLLGHHDRTGRALGALDPIVVAAALPETRADALRSLLWTTRCALTRTPDTIADLRRLARLERGCEGELGELSELGWYEEAVPLARACGDGDREFAALMQLGRYAEAAAVLETGRLPAQQRALAAVAAGRWLDAAIAVDGLANTREAQDDGELPGRNEIVNGLRCLRALFQAHAGVPGAVDQIHTIAATFNGARCQVIEALLLPIERQPAALRAARTAVEEDTPHDARRDPRAPRSPLSATIDDLAWSASGADDGYRYLPSDALLDPYASRVRAWLAPFALASGTAAAHAWMAMHHVDRGDFASAHDEARAAHDARDTIGVDARTIDVVIQLREGVAALQLDPFGERDNRAFYVPAIQLRLGRLDPRELAQLAPADRTSQDPATSALHQAWLGDGGPLAALLDGCAHEPNELLLAVLPRVARQRERLAAALNLRPAAIGRALPFEVVSAGSATRDVARVAGDLRAAARLQAILDRQLAAFADRDRVVAAVLLHVM